MAHMDCINMGDMYGVQNTPLKARARSRFTSSGDAMRQWLKKGLSELLYARARLKYLCLSTPKTTW